MPADPQEPEGSSASRTSINAKGRPIADSVQVVQHPPVDMYLVTFKKAGEVLQTIALPADSPEHALERVEYDRSRYPELGFLTAEGGVQMTAELYVPKRLESE
jgi:hypothetical protein